MKDRSYLFNLQSVVEALEKIMLIKGYEMTQYVLIETNAMDNSSYATIFKNKPTIDDVAKTILDRFIDIEEDMDLENELIEWCGLDYKDLETIFDTDTVITNNDCLWSLVKANVVENKGV